MTPIVDGTTYTVDLSDRTGNTSGVYPVISYGTSTKNYASSVSSYTTTLLNQCALVKSDVTNASGSPAYIQVAYDKVTVGFDGNTITPGTVDGKIQVASGTGDRWAILFPQTAQAAITTTNVAETYLGTQGAFTEGFSANDYVTTAISIALAPDYRFSVSESTKVYFSSGNLQYKDGTGWRFAEHQYDYVEHYGWI